MYRLWVYIISHISNIEYEMFVNTQETKFSVTTICLCFLLLRCTKSVKDITTYYKGKYIF